MVLEWRWDVAPHLAAAIALSLLGLLALSVRRPARPTQMFALFTFLVAGNLLAGWFTALVGAPYGAPHFYSRLELLFLTYDPAALAYFISIYPLPLMTPRNRWLPILLFSVPVVLTIVQLVDFDALARDAAAPARWLLYTYLVAAYLFCLLRLTRLAATSPTTRLRRQVQLLLVAFGVALVPRVALSVNDFRIFDDPLSPGAVATKIALAWAILASLALYALRQAPMSNSAPAVRALAATAPFILLITATWLVEYRTQLDPSVGLLVTSLAWTGRWIVFTVLVAVARWRDRLVEDEPQPRSALLLGSAFLLAVSLVFVLPGLLLSMPTVERPAAALSYADATPLLLVAAAIAAAPLLLRGVLAPRSGRTVDDERAHQDRVDAYRTVLEAVYTGDPQVLEREDLNALRRRLGIAAREHEALVTLVGWRRASRAGKSYGGAGLAKYEISKPLGEGAWGQAFLARERETGDLVVLKRLRAPASHDPSAREALLREAHILQGLRHANVVTLRAVLREPEPILVLEFVPGGSLEDRLRPGEPIAIEQARPIFLDVLKGLAEIHAHGILHRDLKPANVLLSGAGRAKICDFGVSEAPSLARTLRSAPGPAPGTLLYMSPEQARGKPLAATSDLYSVGAMLYRCLTGRAHASLEGMSEFEAGARVAAGGPPAPVPELPAAVEAFLMRALDRNPRKRYQTAEYMAEALAALPAGPFRVSREAADVGRLGSTRLTG